MAATGLALLLVLTSLAPVHAQSTPDQLLFGPQQYLRGNGAPNEFTETFTVPASVGAPFLLHIVNGEADGSHRISAAWITLNDVQVAGPNDFSQNVSVIDRTVTLQPSNTLHVKVASKAGSYLTISVFGTKILPTPTALTPNPLTLTAGSTGTLTATLAPTPTASGTLAVTTGNAGVATVPASVAFASGQSNVPVPVTAVGVGSTVITVSANGGSATSTVQATPEPPTVISLLPPSQTITQGGSGTLTVTISAAQGAGTVVNLTSTDPGIASVPATVTVPAGQTTASIPVAGNSPGTVQIAATLNNSSGTATATVSPALPTVVSLLPPTLPLTLGATGSLIVTLSAAQPIVTEMTLAASPGGIVTVPPVVVVPAGQLTATVPVGTVALGTARVSAGLNGSLVEAAVQVTPPPPVVVALTPSPLSVVVNATGQLTVALNVAQSTNTDVTLAVDNPGLLQVPATVTVQAGQLSAAFTVTGLALGDAVVTATLGTSSRSATVQVVPPPPLILSLLPNPLPLEQGATGTLTLTINAAQPGETVVPLTNSHPTVIQVPASLTVPAGQTSATVAVTGLVLGEATVSATLNGSSASSLIQVTPPPTVVTGLVPAFLSLPKGKPGVLQVTVAPAPKEPTPVSLTSSTPSVATVPFTVTMPAGALVASFPVLSVGEGSAVITAALNGSSATAQVTVTSPEVVSLTLSPQEPTAFQGESVAFTATGTLTDGTTQDLSSDVTWSSSDETVATIGTDGLASTLAPGPTTITATLTTPSGVLTQSTTLTVLEPAPLTLTPETVTLEVGTTQIFQVTSAAAAGELGLTVTLTTSGDGSITVPSSVFIPIGETFVEFNVTGATAGTVTLTAGATGRLSASSTITVTPGLPTISGFTPASGPVGTAVTITGQNFDPVPANNQVTFNGTSGAVPAIITSATATAITTTVPQNAATGLVTVGTPQGTASSPAAFDVSLSQNFNLTPGPLTASAVAGSFTTYALTATSSNQFAGLISLSVTGLPPGATGTLTSNLLAVGGTVYLTVRTQATTPAGVHPFTVTGTGTIDGRVTTQAVPLNLQVIAAGTTTIVGQVLSTDDEPIPGVTLTMATHQNGSLVLTGPSTQTTASGHFLLANVPTGQQIVFVDGRTAPVAGVAYPPVDVVLTIPANQTTEIPFIIYLPKLDIDHPINLPLDGSGATTVEVRAATPVIPDLEVIIPAGTTITSLEGTTVNQITITPVPIDRAPMPPPPGVFARMLFTIQPGGATPSTPIPICFPNDSERIPGDKADLYFFDVGIGDWAIWGTGTVTDDGRQVCSDPGFGLPTFAWHFPLAAPTNGLGNQSAGDPVDLATGQFNLNKTDVVLPGRLPVSLVRHYQSGDTRLGPFGIGTSHNYNWTLRTVVGAFAALIGPDGRQARFSFISQLGASVNTTEPWLAGAKLTGSFFDGKFTLRFKDGTEWEFNRNGNLLFQRDRNGNEVRLTREDDSFFVPGRVVQITEPAGRSLILSYDGANRIIQITDPLGRVIRYAYDFGGRLATVTDQAGGITRYSYDGSSRLKTVTDPRGNVFLTNEYDSAGRVTKQTLADGGTWQFAYTVEGGIITLTTITDPNGNVSKVRINSAGFGLDRTDSQGQVTRQVREVGTNLVLSRADPLGRKTAFTYDAAGNVTSITDADGHITQFEYDLTFNLVTKITDALNQITTFTYDAKGNLLTTTDPLNQTTTITYNAFGQPTGVTDPLNNTTTFAYNAQGDLVSTTDPLGNTTHRAYDGVSRLISLTDPRSLTTQFRYDDLDRVTEIADARQGLTRFAYDPNGNLLTVTDAKNQATTYTYDPMDRLATREDALGRLEGYQYDSAGNLTQFIDRKSQQSTYTYDVLHRRTGAQYADGSSTSFVYDSVGRLGVAEDSSSGRIEFTYDSLDRLVKELAPQGMVEYAYDALGRRATMTVSGQQPVVYSYDAASRLTQVAQGTLEVGLEYDAAGRRNSLTYPNGVNTSYSYDTASRVTSIVHNGPAGLIESLSYTYDAAGNRISLTRANAEATLLPQAVQAAYDAANEQIQFGNPLPGTPNLTYDANGNLATSTDGNGTTTYTWDARNRLMAQVGPGISASFTYDPLGRRVRKTINGTETTYLYDGRDIVQENGGSSLAASYVRSLNIDEPFIRQSASGSEYYHVDALGSTLDLSNQAGVVQASYRYEAFGKTVMTGISSNPFKYTGRENDSQGSYYYRARYYSSENQRFIGQDPILAPFVPIEVGLCRLSFSPVWLLPGEIRSLNAMVTQEFNQYSYTINNPLAFKDSTGLAPVRCDPQYAKCIISLTYQEDRDCITSIYRHLLKCDASDQQCINKVWIVNGKCANKKIINNNDACIGQRNPKDSFFDCTYPHDQTPQAQQNPARSNRR